MAAEEQNFNLNDLNLDFLELTPPNASNLTAYPTVRCATSFATSKPIRGNAFKARQLAQRVADCDSLVKKTQQIETLKQQLNDFQQSAKEIRTLYETEREHRKELQVKAEQLQRRCEQLDVELAQRILHQDQLQAQLDEIKGPFNYIDLALKYLKLSQKLNEENALYWQERSVFNELSKYCENKGKNVPVLKSPKKRTRIQKHEKAAQCLILEDPQEPPLKEVSSRSTQCERIEVKSQGTQHISTTTTRSTSTSCFIKQHSVGTSFPELTVLPPLTKMLEEILLFNDISPLSPISDLQSPPPPDIEMNKEAEIESVSCRSIGTCTFLCNVQRPIDFLPPLPKLNCTHSQSQMQFTCDNVKHEAASTPCPSPPPITPNHEAMSASGTVKKCLSRLPELAEIPPDMFTTIWQMAGQMFMGLLYTPSGSRTYMPVNGTSESIKQEEFHSWLFSLYESVQQKSQENWQSTDMQEHLLPPVPISTTNIHSDILQSETRREDSYSRKGVNMIQDLNDYTTKKIASSNYENKLDVDIVTIPPINDHSSKNKHSISAFKQPQQLQQKSVQRKKLKSKKTLSRKKRNMSKRICKESVNHLQSNKNYIKCKCDNFNNKECCSSETKPEIQFVQNASEEFNVDNEDFNTAVEFCAELYSQTKQNYNARNSDEVNNVQMMDLNMNSEFLRENDKGDDNSCGSLSNSQEHISVEKNISKDEVRCNNKCIEFSTPTQAIETANSGCWNTHESLSINLDQNLFGSDSESENGYEINAKQYKTNIKHDTLNVLCENIEREKESFGESDLSDSVLVIDETVTENKVVNSCSLLRDNADAKINNETTTTDEVKLRESKTDVTEIIDTTNINEITVSDSINEIINDILSENLSSIRDAKSSVHEERKRKANMKSVLQDNYSTHLRAKQCKLENLCIINANNCEERPDKHISIDHNFSGKSEVCNDVLQTCDNTDNDYIKVANILMCEKTLSPRKVYPFIDVTSKEMPLKHYTKNISTDRTRDAIEISCTQYSIIEPGNLEKQNKDETIQNSEDEKSNDPSDNYTVDDSPASPVSPSNITNSQDSIVPCIPLDLDRTYFSNKSGVLIEHFINCYSTDDYKIVTGKRSAFEKEQSKAIEAQIKTQLQKYLKTPLEIINIEAASFTRVLQSISENCETIAAAIVEQIKDAPRPQDELECPIDKIPPKYVGSHLKLISVMLSNLQRMRPCCVSAVLTKIENTLFRYQNINMNSASIAFNLIQLYLLTIPIHYSTAKENPARLLVAKILYYYNLKAIPMVYEVLCHYPTTLPHREERSYDRSDALITVIQHILMCTNYNMESIDLRTKELLSMLRFQYHFEPFKPTATEVLSNLVAKLKAGKLVNLKYAFAVFCKRQRALKVINDVLQMQLIPLVNEYYHLMQHTCDYDERIATLLDSMSMIIKPFPLDTNIDMYLSIFRRFLNAVERPVIQEAAVMAILRMQRFGHIQCFRALSNYSPSYTLQPLTRNALKTFIHRKPLNIWTGLLKQNKCN